MGDDDDIRSMFELLGSSIDALMIFAFGTIIFLMQGGFAFLEAGSVRSKNTVNILIKNMLDALIGGMSYWAVGWAFAYGSTDNGFIGTKQFFSVGMPYDKYPLWFFQYVFAATAATIVSGSIAERCQFLAYFIYSVLITGVVYPVVTHWAWGGGWLSKMGYVDFAGSGVVHLLGGVCALVGCVCIGYRHGRFDADGNPVDMPGHSIPLAALGGFILLMGFLAFNGGSQLTISKEGDAETIARIIVNTILGGSAGGVIVLLINKKNNLKWSYLMTLNGTLSGMVAQCSGCNVYQPWAALIVGFLGGLSFIPGHYGMLALKLDDPLDAVAVHGIAGIVGVLAMPFFAYEEGIFWKGNESGPWRQLGVNLFGVIVITLWSGVLSLCIFLPLRYFGLLRVNKEIEFTGNDLPKHGEAAYPADAWVEMQYNNGMPSHMAGTEAGTTNERAVPYNDAQTFFPAMRQIFGGRKKSNSENNAGGEERSSGGCQTNAAFSFMPAIMESMSRKNSGQEVQQQGARDAVPMEAVADKLQ